MITYTNSFFIQGVSSGIIQAKEIL